MSPCVRLLLFRKVFPLVVCRAAIQLLAEAPIVASGTASAAPNAEDLSTFARYLLSYSPGALTTKAVTSSELYVALKEAFRTTSVERDQNTQLVGKNATTPSCHVEADEFSAALDDVELLSNMPLLPSKKETAKQGEALTPAALSSCASQEFVAKTINARLLNKEVVQLLATVADLKDAGHRAFQVGTFLDYIREAGVVTTLAPALIDALVEHLARLHEEGERMMKQLIVSVRAAMRVIEEDWDVGDQTTDERQKGQVLEFLSFFGEWATLSLRSQQARWNAIRRPYLSFKRTSGAGSMDESPRVNPRSAEAHGHSEGSLATLESIQEAEAAGLRDLDMAKRVKVRAAKIANQGLMPSVFADALLSGN